MALFFCSSKDTADPEALDYSTEDTGNGLDEDILDVLFLFQWSLKQKRKEGEGGSEKEGK